MLKDFKEFAMRGNMADRAAGILIGAAFGPGAAARIVPLPPTPDGSP